MFIVCGENENSNKVGVLDTEDGVIEFYSKPDLLSIVAKGIPVMGVSDGKVTTDIEKIASYDKLLAYGVPRYLCIHMQGDVFYYEDLSFNEFVKFVLHNTKMFKFEPNGKIYEFCVLNNNVSIGVCLDKSEDDGELYYYYNFFLGDDIVEADCTIRADSERVDGKDFVNFYEMFKKYLKYK